MNHIGCKLVATAALATILASASGARASMFDDMMKTAPAYGKLPKIKHTPAFRLEAFDRPKEQEAEGKEWYWLYDGEQKIGMIQTWTKEIEMFRFTRGTDGEPVDYTIPAIHHWGTMVGAKLSMNAPLWLPEKSFKLEFVKKEGDRIELKTLTELQNGTIGEGVFTLAWDETLGYVWKCETHIRMQKPAAVEFNNILAGGVSESRTDRQRWQKVLRGVEPGKMTWFYLNPLNTPAGSIAGNGFVGFVREPDMNPFVALDEVNGSGTLATCSQWYDQHIIASPPKEPEADGLHHLRTKYRFLSMPAAVAEHLESKAESINAGPMSASGGRPGFLSGVINDFENPVPGDQLYNGPIWRQPVSWDRTQGKSGNSSLKVSGKGPDKRVFAAPIGGGTAVYGESAKRYRVSAWVKCELEAGEAYIEVDDCFWNWEDVRATRRTKGVSKKSKWTELSVEFQPSSNDPFLLIKLCVDGTGDAWFDDLTLIEISE